MERILNAIVILFIIGLISTIPIMIHKHQSDKDLRYKYKIFIRHHGVFRTNSYQREKDCISFIDEDGRKTVICTNDIEIRENR